MGEERDRWIITATHTDGSVTVRRTGTHAGGKVRLPAGYVPQNVELACAVTAYRAQGATVDAVVHSSQMIRETFSVAMTRGRDANTDYVATDKVLLDEHRHVPDCEVAVRTILMWVLNHEGAQKSVHETLTAEHNSWVALIGRSGLTLPKLRGVLTRNHLDRPLQNSAGTKPTATTSRPFCRDWSPPEASMTQTMSAH